VGGCFVSGVWWVCMIFMKILYDIRFEKKKKKIK